MHPPPMTKSGPEDNHRGSTILAFLVAGDGAPDADQLTQM